MAKRRVSASELGRESAAVTVLALVPLARRCKADVDTYAGDRINTVDHRNLLCRWNFRTLYGDMSEKSSSVNLVAMKSPAVPLGIGQG
jgi:hypothetical protein